MDQSDIQKLLVELRAARSDIGRRDQKITALETSVNDLMRQRGRPGGDHLTIWFDRKFYRHVTLIRPR